MSYLLDTCILSKLRKIKKYPDEKLETWLAQHPESSYFVSTLTLGEIESGINKLDHNKPEERAKKVILEDWLKDGLIPRFKDRILSIDLDVALAWGRLYGGCQKKGIQIPLIDGLIAATAIAHNLTVVTENINDFLESGAQVFSPWLLSGASA